ncbi:MAG: hypothetical protein HY854_11900 [Burkholderiales bacterium]|nr:hypothetical protein [Burkholderiales bacterium]
MESVTAFPLSEVNAVQVSSHGLQMLLHAKDGKSREVVIAVPYDQLRTLLLCTAVAQQRCEKVLKVQAKDKQVLNASGAEVMPFPDSSDALVSVPLEGDARVNIRMEEATLKALYDALHLRFGA